MHTLTALISLAFLGSVGVTLLIIGCATPDPPNWLPLFVVVFYIFSPIPVLVSRKANPFMAEGGSSPCREFGLFITVGIVVSAFGITALMGRHPEKPMIPLSTCLFTLGANVVVFITILGFMITFGSEDFDDSLWL